MGKKEQILQLQIENEELTKEIETLKKELKKYDTNSLISLQNKIKSLKSELSYIEGLSDDIEFGIYNPNLDFLHNDYIKVWEDNKVELRNISKDKDTISIIDPMKLGGSEAKGTKLQKDIAKLGIIHLNNFANVQFKNINQVNFEVQRLKFEKEFDKINKVLLPIKVEISPEFYNKMFYTFEIVMNMKLQKENDKEEARLERERIKEEEKLQREVEEKLAKIDNEIEKYQLRIKELEKDAKLNVANKDKEILKLKEQIESLQDESTDVVNRLKRTGAGYVYIISNIGSFGKNIYKIGVTRRLEPELRIRELSSASVPFIFDKHALIWSEQAFELENRLHKFFDAKRVNKANKRKEFFKVTLDEIKEEVVNITDASIKWIQEPEAIEYRLTLEQEGQ